MSLAKCTFGLLRLVLVCKSSFTKTSWFSKPYVCRKSLAKALNTSPFKYFTQEPPSLNSDFLIVCKSIVDPGMACHGFHCHHEDNSPSSHYCWPMSEASDVYKSTLKTLSHVHGNNIQSGAVEFLTVVLIDYNHS